MLQNDAAAVENNMVVLQKLKNRTTNDLTIPFLGIHPEDLKAGTQTGICTTIFIAALFAIAKGRSNPCLMTNE